MYHICVYVYSLRTAIDRGPIERAFQSFRGVFPEVAEELSLSIEHAGLIFKRKRSRTRSTSFFSDTRGGFTRHFGSKRGDRGVRGIITREFFFCSLMRKK